MSMLKVFAAVVAILLSSTAIAQADDDVPGPAWITMDQALHDLHKAGYREVIKLEAEDGYWKAKVARGHEVFKIRLDPHSGAVVSRRRDHDDN